MLCKMSKLTGWKKRFSALRTAVMVFCALIASAGGIYCAEVPFGNQSLIAGLAPGLQSMHSADLNGDGYLDILPASTISNNTLIWYQNLGDEVFEACAMTDADLPTSEAELLAWFAPAVDLDRDGDLDILAVLHIPYFIAEVEEQYDEYFIVWYPNDGKGNFGARREIYPDPDAPDEPTSISTADLDSDGDLDILAVLRHRDAVPQLEEYYIVWYANDGEGNFGIPQNISEKFSRPITASSADLDGDGHLDILSASQGDNQILWYRNKGATGFELVEDEIGSPGGARLALATDLDGDSDLDVLSAPSDDVMAWFENDGAGNFSQPRFIFEEDYFDTFSSVHPIDLDHDGDIDLLTGSEFEGSIAWYENCEQNGQRYFQRRLIQQLPAIALAAASARAFITAADIDADGDSDVLAALLGGDSDANDSLVYFKNESLHQTADFESTSEISTDDAVTSNISADVDRDGDQDLVVGTESGEISVYENIGGKISTEKTIIEPTDDKARRIVVLDYDRDGDNDILACDRTGIRLYERRNAAYIVPETDLVHFPAEREVLQFEAADLDRDAKPELLLAYSEASTDEVKLVCYAESAPALTAPVVTAESTPRLEQTIVEYALLLALIQPASIQSINFHLADIFQSGRLDLILAYKVPNEDRSRIVLFENPGEIEQWQKNPPAPVSVSEEAACEEFDTADMDRDGDLDIITATKDSEGAVRTVWLENEKVAAVPAEAATLDAPASRSFAAENVICENDVVPTSIRVADLDRDGDADVLRSSSDSLSLYENTDGTGTDFADEKVILDSPCELADPVDLDSDGNLDILYYRDSDNPGIGLCQNGSGQFALDTLDTAPEHIAPGEMDDVFRIDVTHSGRPGENPIELATLELLLEKEAGIPLKESEANALVDELSIYLDDGSGTFEPDKDVVKIDTELRFEENRQSIVFQDGDPMVEVACGLPKSYFVVVKLAEDADQQGVDHFQLTHLTESSSTAEDSIRDVRLTMQKRRDTTSRRVSVGDEPLACTPGDPCGSSVGQCAQGTLDTSCNCVGAVGPAPEVCDGIDNDCDGEIDEALYQPCFSACGAGTATCIAGTWGCDAPAPEIEICDGIDNDCDLNVDEDLSRVCSNACGVGTETCVAGTWICDAPAPETEICDNIDNDCDGVTDEGFDQDKDGFTSCNGDCNDDDAGLNPETIWFKDSDGDGYSDGTFLVQCGQPSGYVLASELYANKGDCGDDDSAINPAADEICDGLDNDCDSEVDEGVTATFYQDVDADGYGNPSRSVEACSPSPGYVADNSDCDDTNGAVNPAAAEICDELDNDCDGEVDEGNICSTAATLCSRLGSSRLRSTDFDVFKFSGKSGEQVILSLTAQPEGAVGAVNFSVYGPRTYRMDLSELPNKISLTLPRTGTYFVMISNLVRNSYSGNYCLMLESQPVGNASLAPVWSVED